VVHDDTHIHRSQVCGTRRYSYSGLVLSKAETAQYSAFCNSTFSQNFKKQSDCASRLQNQRANPHISCRKSRAISSVLPLIFHNPPSTSTHKPDEHQTDTVCYFILNPMASATAKRPLQTTVETRNRHLNLGASPGRACAHARRSVT
jgi:hypothetical protein